ncbi:MAG: hypothetical protein RR326_02960 [Stenotrophomonas sp.]
MKRPITLGLTADERRDLKLPPLMAAHALADDRETESDVQTLRFGLRVFAQVCRDWFPDSWPDFRRGDMWVQLQAGAEMIDRCTRRELRDSFRKIT